MVCVDFIFYFVFLACRVIVIANDSGLLFLLSWYSTSTETVRFIRDGGSMGYGMRAHVNLPVHTVHELCQVPVVASLVIRVTSVKFY